MTEGASSGGSDEAVWEEGGHLLQGGSSEVVLAPTGVPFVLAGFLGSWGEEDLIPGADGISWLIFISFLGCLWRSIMCRWWAETSMSSGLRGSGCWRGVSAAKHLSVFSWHRLGSAGSVTKGHRVTPSGAPSLVKWGAWGSSGSALPDDRESRTRSLFRSSPQLVPGWSLKFYSRSGIWWQVQRKWALIASQFSRHNYFVHFHWIL